ncbi:MAG TPA: hypothetical protein VIX86_25530 [Streptosporangiaceae bacterium]
MRRFPMAAASAVLAFGAAVASGPVAAAAVGAGGPAPAAAHGHVLATLNDPGGSPSDDFSISAVSVDDSTAVVGAEGTNLAHGAVYIYLKGRHGWPTSPTVTLPDPGNSNSDIFGQAVSVSGDTIVVGAYGANGSQGAAYIYVKGDHGWPKKPTVTLADPAATSGDLFGAAASVSGNTAVVGAWNGPNPGGQAYIYVKGRHGWPKKPTTTLGDPAATASDLFGASVSISGNALVVGAYNGNAAYIYVKGTHGWPTSQTTTLADPGGSGDNFGSTVATADQTTLVGAPFANGVAGAVYVYVKGTGGWSASPTTTLADPGSGPSDQFGTSVGIDGGTALVGAVGVNSSNGAVYTYLRGSSGWPANPTATVADPAASPGTDYFGQSVAVDDNIGVGGAWGTLGDIGAAYIFTP